MLSQKSADLTKKESSFSDLPLEIVELILSKLPLSSCIRFSICMNQKFTAPLFYHINMDTPLLLYYSTIDSGIWQCYSPSLNISFSVDCPNFNLSGFDFLYAKNGWLLIYNKFEMLLLDPFIGSIKKFPGLRENIAFSGVIFFGSPPDNCTIFIIDSALVETEVYITIYDQNGWEKNTYKNNEPFCLAPSSNPVYCGNQIYCLGEDGNLGIYDPEERSWTIIDAKFEQYDRTLMDSSYLVESSGMLLAVQTEKYNTGIHIFCLDQEKMVWEETYNLVNQSLFIGSRMSIVSTIHVDQKLSGRAYMPRFLEVPEPISVEAERMHDKLYFRPKSINYLHQEKEVDEEAKICYHSLADRKPFKHFGSKLKSHSIWYEPCYAH